jgi:BirA family biotin operon repressor/biotin-[acetyl-CoA-carboxylase] ligase
MNQQILEDKLSDLPIGDIYYTESIGSTNDAAAEWAERDAPNNSIVLADTQTQGRGRSGRKWFTYPGSALAFSLVLRLTSGELKETASLISRFTGLGALAVCQVLRSHYTVHAQIKWPNDVLVNNRKICGILAESDWLGDKLSCIILGLGINITTNAIPPDGHVQYHATSLEIELGYRVNRLTFLHQVLTAIIAWRSQLLDDNFLHTWESYLAFRGELVRVVTASQPGDEYSTLASGYIVGLGSDGAIILRTNTGSEVVVRDGEIPAPQAGISRSERFSLEQDDVHLRLGDESGEVRGASKS